MGFVVVLNVSQDQEKLLMDELLLISVAARYKIKDN